MDANKTINWVLGIGAILVGLKVAKATNLFGNPDKNLNDALQDDPVNFWSANYYQTLGWTQAKKDAVYLRAKPAARILKNDVFGYFSDDFAKAYAAIKTMQTQAEISFLVHVFYYEYGEDLYTFLRNGNWTPGSGLSDTNMATINRYIQNLPKK